MLLIVCLTSLFSGCGIRRHDCHFEKYLPDECEIYKRETEIVTSAHSSFLQSNAAMLQLTVFLTSRLENRKSFCRLLRKILYRK